MGIVAGPLVNNISRPRRLQGSSCPVIDLSYYNLSQLHGFQIGNPPKMQLTNQCVGLKLKI